MRKITSKYISEYKTFPLAAKAAFWFTVCAFLQKSVLALTTPVFARLMSTEQYGQFTMYTSWSNILLIISMLKLDDSVFNVGMSKYKNQRDEYVSTMQFITIGLSTLLLCMFSLLRSKAVDLIGLSGNIILLMIIETYANSAVYFWNRRKRYEYKYKPVLVRIVGMTLLSTVLGLVLVLDMNEKGYGRILSCALINIVFGAGILVYNLKTGQFRFNRRFAKFAILFNLPLLGHYLSVYILDQFDRIMVQKLSGFSAAALYGLAYHMGTILTLFTTSLNNALTPWIYGKLEREELKGIGRAVYSVMLIVCVIAALVAAMAPELILIFGGQRYQEAMYVIPPVACGMIFQFLYLIFANIEFFYGKNKAAMYMSGFAAVLDVLLNYIGIKLLGYTAAAYTTLMCYAILFVFHFLYVRRYFRVEKNTDCNLNIKNISVMVLLTTIVCLMLQTLYSDMYTRLTLVIIGLGVMCVYRNTITDLVKSIRN